HHALGRVPSAQRVLLLEVHRDTVVATLPPSRGDSRHEGVHRGTGRGSRRCAYDDGHERDRGLLRPSPGVRRSARLARDDGSPGPRVHRGLGVGGGGAAARPGLRARALDRASRLDRARRPRGGSGPGLRGDRPARPSRGPLRPRLFRGAPAPGGGLGRPARVVLADPPRTPTGPGRARGSAPGTAARGSPAARLLRRAPRGELRACRGHRPVLAERTDGGPPGTGRIRDRRAPGATRSRRETTRRAARPPPAGDAAPGLTDRRSNPTAPRPDCAPTRPLLAVTTLGTMGRRTQDGSAGDADYGTIGSAYSRYRRPDPRIAAEITQALGAARTVL